MQYDFAGLVSKIEKWKTAYPFPAVTAIAHQYARDPWAVLASTIISLRTKDAVTLKQSTALLEKAGTPKKLLALDGGAIERLIYPAGFYKTKAKNLQKIAAIIIDEYDGAVPDSMEELLRLPGVGRKTANLVLIEGFDKEGICVDTHVHRICNRLGIVATKTPDATEAALREVLPKKFWRRLNELLVLYGQNLCTPLSPHCSLCPVTKQCARHGVERTR